jgi:hypothetical protein
MSRWEIASGKGGQSGRPVPGNKTGPVRFQHEGARLVASDSVGIGDNDYEYTANWTEFLHDAEHAEILPDWQQNDGHLPGSIHGDPEFTGTDCYDDALRLLKYGHPDGRSKMAESVEWAQAITRERPAPSWSHSVSGAMPDVPVYLSGEPEHMLMSEGDEGQGVMPIVSVVVNVVAACSVNSDRIRRRGAALVALINSIETSGQRVELIAASRAGLRKERGKTASYLITVKEPNEALDLDRVAFTLAHPSMLRRILFRLEEITLPKREPSYGYPRDYPEAAFPAGTMYVPKIVTSDASTQEVAVSEMQELWQGATRKWQAADD